MLMLPPLKNVACIFTFQMIALQFHVIKKSGHFAHRGYNCTSRDEYHSRTLSRMPGCKYWSTIENYQFRLILSA